MPRHGVLGKVEQLDDIAHAQLAGGEEVQYANANGIGEAPEEGIEISELRTVDSGQCRGRARHETFISV